MSNVSTKALYLFLCSILGMVLFAMLHRSIFVLYDLVLILDYDMYSLGMDKATVMVLDFFSMLAALFFGGWYGIALGLDWHAQVYDAQAESGDWLHAFLPHSWRGKKSAKKSSDDVFATLPPVVIKPKTVPIKSITTKSVAKPAAEKTMTESASWNFDDFLKATPAPTKKAVRKTAVKKTATKVVRKTVTKRTASPRIIVPE